ncbi:MAG: hypothetical protein ACRCUI_09965 [Polymorphobacter sp.]
MDTPNSSASFDIVAGDPAAYFETPQGIVDDATLNRAEKLQLLNEWALDLADRNTAVDEGMVPDHGGPLDRDVQMAAAVTAAHATVSAGADSQVAALPLRLWKRLTGRA